MDYFKEQVTGAFLSTLPEAEATEFITLLQLDSYTADEVERLEQYFSRLEQFLLQAKEDMRAQVTSLETEETQTVSFMQQLASTAKAFTSSVIGQAHQWLHGQAQEDDQADIAQIRSQLLG